jgi:hypothetical protein
MQHYFQHKLTCNNYLLLRDQFLPYLKAQHLIGYVDGTLLCPEPMSSDDLYAYLLMHEMVLEHLSTSLDLSGSFANATFLALCFSH